MTGQKKPLTINLRDAIRKLRAIPQAKEFLLPIKNWDLFHELKRQGRIKEERPGVYTTVESLRAKED